MKPFGTFERNNQTGEMQKEGESKRLFPRSSPLDPLPHPGFISMPLSWDKHLRVTTAG